MHQQRHFPQDIQCLIEPTQGKGGIFVSNIQAAQNPHTLQKWGIGSVITCVKGKNLCEQMPKHIEYLYVPAVDSETFDISQYFSCVNSFIEEEKKRTNILVHCMAGISRSITLIAAFLMKEKQLPFEEVFSFLKSKRSIIHPNDGFIHQLKQYEKQIMKVSRSSVARGSAPCSESNNRKERQGTSQKSYDENLKESIRKIFQQRSVNMLSSTKKQRFFS